MNYWLWCLTSPVASNSNAPLLNYSNHTNMAASSLHTTSDLLLSIDNFPLAKTPYLKTDLSVVPLQPNWDLFVSLSWRSAFLESGLNRQNSLTCLNSFRFLASSTFQAVQLFSF